MQAVKAVLSFLLGLGFLGFLFWIFSYVFAAIRNDIAPVLTLPPYIDLAFAAFTAMIIGSLILLGLKNMGLGLGERY